MLSIILTGHGGFASGMEKAMKQILRFHVLFRLRNKEHQHHQFLLYHTFHIR